MSATRRGPYIPPVVRPPRLLHTKYGTIYDPGYEARRPDDPWIGIRQQNIFKWDKKNIEEMLNGRPPWGHDGKKVILHHRAQQPNGPLDEYSATLHQQQSGLLHGEDYTRIDRQLFDAQRARYWVWRALEHLAAN
jgi:hypothetical protein